MFTQLLVGLLALTPDPQIQNPWYVSIRADRSTYVAGEPIRLTLTVRNVSDTTRWAFDCRDDPGSGVFLEIHPRRGGRQFRDLWFRLPPKRLFPGDSLRTFVQVEAPRGCVDSDGKYLYKFPRTTTFRRLGQYAVRVCTRMPVTERKIAVTVRSNALFLDLREPTRTERKLLDALWDVGAVGEQDFFWNCETEGRARWSRPEDAERLRNLAHRYYRNPLARYLEFAAAAGISTSNGQWSYRAAGLGCFAADHPDFLPGTVALQYALSCIPAAELDRDWDCLGQACAALDSALKRDSGLRADPEFMFAYDRVHERDGDLEVRLTPSKRSCVIGEPMLFRLTLRNASRYTVHVPGPSYWEPEDDSFTGYLEVESPNGAREYRTTPTQVISCGIEITGYGGVPLAPGDSVSYSWRVDRTVRLHDPTARGYGYDYGPLFSTAGVYRIRGGYTSRPQYWRLSGRGRMLLSLPVQITVRAPDAREQEILTAIPKESLLAPRGDSIPLMRAVLDRFPEHELAMYVRMRLAEAIRWNERDPSGAATLIDEARRQATGLWRDELTRVAVQFGRFSKEQSTPNQVRRSRLIALMAEKPGLWTDDLFAHTVVYSVLSDERDAAGYALSYWRSRLHAEGPSPPSWAELRRVSMEASSPDAQRKPRTNPPKAPRRSRDPRR